MLGHQRNRVTLAAREQLQQGLIEYGSGNMRILDRVRLEAAACQCYRVIKDSIQQVFVGLNRSEANPHPSNLFQDLESNGCDNSRRLSEFCSLESALAGL